MKESTYSEKIANSIKCFLEEENWHFLFDEQRGFFRLSLSLDGKIKRINYHVYVSKTDYVVYAISPIGIEETDEEMKIKMADFICHVNCGMHNGNFELDRDGEISFKSYVDCEGTMPTNEIIRNSIYCPAAMFERYGTGLSDIIFKNSTSIEALKRCGSLPKMDLQELLGEEFDENENIETMIERLSKKLGISRDENSDDDSNQDCENDDIEIKSELFRLKGGNVE